MANKLQVTDDGGSIRFWMRIFWPALIIAPMFAYGVLKWGKVVVGAAPERVVVVPGDMLSLPALVVMFVVIAFPCLGVLGVHCQRRLGFWRTEILVLMVTLSGVLCSEFLVRNVYIQRNFWKAVISRLDPSDWAMREPAFLHFDTLRSPDRKDYQRAISIFGSSPAATNIDRDELARRLDRPVIRRALAGTFALEMCSARHMLSVPVVETALFYMSPLDFAGNTAVRADWMRSKISPQSWRDVVSILGPDLALENKRALAELFLASYSKLWAFRDYFLWLLMHMAGLPLPEQHKHAVDALPPQQAVVLKEAYIQASKRGYQFFMTGLKDLGFNVIVFEGQINPVLRGQFSDEYWVLTQSYMASFCRSNNFRFVPLSEYKPDVHDANWIDNTHLNSAGCQNVTDAIIHYLIGIRN